MRDMDELVFEVREMLAEITAAQHPHVAAALLEGALDGDRSFVVLSVLEALARDGAASELVHDTEQWLVGVAQTAPTHELVQAACRVAETLSGAPAAELDEQWRAAAAMAVADGRENVFPVGPVEEGPFFTGAEDRALPSAVPGADGDRSSSGDRVDEAQGRAANDVDLPGAASTGGPRQGTVPPLPGPGSCPALLGPRLTSDRRVTRREKLIPVGVRASLGRRTRPPESGRGPPVVLVEAGLPPPPRPRRAPVPRRFAPRAGSRLPGTPPRRTCIEASVRGLPIRLRPWCRRQSIGRSSIRLSRRGAPIREHVHPSGTRPVAPVRTRRSGRIASTARRLVCCVRALPAVQRSHTPHGAAPSGRDRAARSPSSSGPQHGGVFSCGSGLRPSQSFANPRRHASVHGDLARVWNAR